MKQDSTPVNESNLYSALERPGTIWLDASLQDSADDTHYRAPEAVRSQSVLFVDPVCIHTATRLDDVVPLLHRLENARRSGRYVAGYLAYEAGAAFEPVLQAHLPSETAGPLAWFGEYETCRNVPPLAELQRSFPTPEISEFALSLNRRAYSRCVGQVLDAIHEGDVYQVNLTNRLRFRLSSDAAGLFAALRAHQRVRYGAFINAGDHRVLSLSPELFFQVDGDRICTRPMKGTAPRAIDPVDDGRTAVGLRKDAKNRAENLMIVDLLRNDLSHIAEVGSVAVRDLFRVETYETLHQMTSMVVARLRPGTGIPEIFGALFPCGSVTGAPRIRAMQTIGTLEKDPRGVYCGALGYAAPDARAVFNVAIRTIVVRGTEAEMGTGSGIVWDSVPDDEFDEALIKTRFLRAVAKTHVDLSLIETMRAMNGVIPLLDLHLERLERSALFFGFPVDRNAIREELQAHAGTRAYRIRLLMEPDGRFNIEKQAIDDLPGFPNANPNASMGRDAWRVGLANDTVDAGDTLLRHKTTRRRMFDDALDRARASDVDELLFFNERGELTQGTRTNVFVLLGGVWTTPPTSSGLLSGVFRAFVLERNPHIRIRVVKKEELRQAEAITVCNAVRGFVPAELVPGPD